MAFWCENAKVLPYLRDVVTTVITSVNQIYGRLGQEKNTIHGFDI